MDDANGRTMNMRNRIIVAMVVVMALVAGWVSAQVATTPVDPPIVLSGSDVGFRIEGRRGSVAVGKLIVRIDGRWVETDFSGGVLRLTTR